MMNVYVVQRTVHDEVNEDGARFGEPIGEPIAIRSSRESAEEYARRLRFRGEHVSVTTYEMDCEDGRKILGKQSPPPTPAAVVIVTNANLGPDTWHVFEDADDAMAWRGSLPAETWVRAFRRMRWEFHWKGETK